jgi:hypothetical protein
MFHKQIVLASAAAIAAASASALAVVTPYSTGQTMTITGPHAGTYQTLTPVPVDSGALADDPTLAHFRVWDLQVNIDSGDHWAGADLRAQLFGGATFYIPPSSDSNVADTLNLHNQTGTRYLRDDTFVATPSTGFPNGSRVSMFGSSSRNNPPNGSATFPSNGTNFTDDIGNPIPANDRTLVDLTWLSTSPVSNNASGVQTIARLTVDSLASDGSVAGDPAQGGIVGLVVGKITYSSDAGAAPEFTFVIPAVPEPAGILLLSAGAGAIALRRGSRER